LVSDGPLPKPLVEVGGQPLLSRIMRTLYGEGIRETVVVTGYKGELIQSTVRSWGLPMNVEFVQNDDWRLSNGVSLVKARQWVDGHCILSMSDHLYASDLVRTLLDFDVAPQESVLGVDRKVGEVFDIDDATKVLCNGRGILNIAKTLTEYDAIDTGVFRISPALVDELTSIYETRGDCSLSEGVLSLSQRGLMAYADVEDAFWVDVDTPLAMHFAEIMLRALGDDLRGWPKPAYVAGAGARTLALAAAAW